MKRTFTILSLFILGHSLVNAQCNFRTTAVASGDTLWGSAGDEHKTSLAYNPGTMFYYSNNAGGSTPCEVFDLNGDQVFVYTPTDWRGLWYNSITERIEGNAWNNLLIEDALQSDGNFGGTTTSFGSFIAPDPQAPAVFDAGLNRFYFYKLGELYSFNRVDLSPIDTVTLTGLTTINEITSTALIFTGCSNHEIGLFHNATKTLHLFNKSNGALMASIPFPSDATIPSMDNRHFAFTNDIVWMYAMNTKQWIGYDIFDPNAGVMKGNIAESIKLYPNPATSVVTIELNAVASIEIIDICGKVMLKSEGNDHYQVDISSFKNGVYFIRTQEGEVVKFVKE